MSGYTDSEKIQYALKTALYRTMQTSLSDSASVERSAPLRVFPTNIMKVNIIEAGKGDIGEDGTYVTGHTTVGQTADLSDPESTVKNYKIICPVNNVITSITISALVGYGSSTKSFVDGRGTSGTSYPLKQWFFRGHYSGSGEAAFNAANGTYDGLQLAWNSATNGTTPTEAEIVPHLKYYLQVQTNYTGVSHSSSVDNITYEHGLLKGLIGLDSNFVSTIMVAQGEGGPSSSASLGTSGSQAGDFWFTQPTAGILSFYGVTNKVDASTDLASFNTKYPMVSYVRYTGETGFGAGTGGGGGGSVTLASADSNVSNMIGGTAQTMTTTSFNFDGNVGINMDSPYFRLHISGSGQNWDTSPGIGFDDFANNKHWYVGTANNITAGDFYIRTCASNSTYPTTANGLTIQHGGNVGIGRTDPTQVLDVKFPDATSGDDPLFIQATRSGLGHAGVGFRAGDGNWHAFWEHTHGDPDRMNFGMYRAGSGKQVYMALTHQGRLGIGTTNPGAPLEIYKKGHNSDEKGGAIILSRFVQGQDGVTANSGDPYRGSCIWHEYTSGNDCMMFASSSNANPYTLSPSMVLTNQGNVGIGTTTPSEKLEVNGKVLIGDVLLGEHYTADYFGIIHKDLIGDNDNYAFLCEKTGHTYVNCKLGKEIHLREDNDEIMTLKGGKVGIGTTNPADTLHLGSPTAYGDSHALRIGAWGNSNNGFKFYQAATTAFLRIDYMAGTNAQVIDKEIMTLSYTGNVGIGTTSPGISLDVHGTYLGRYYNFGSCHDADKRNSFYIGRWDGSTTQSGVFLGMQLKVDTHDNMGYGSYDNQASIIFQTWGNNYSTSREIMEITANGYVRGINAYQNDSDDRIKHNEKNINAGLNVINKLQAKEYFKTSTLFDENGNIYDSNHNFNLNIDGLPIDASGEVLTDVNKEIGFIAQEVFEIDELKHAVREGNLVSDASGNMYKNKFGLSYEEIFVMNVVATQELDRKVIALESENVELKTKVATLESELAAIKQHLGI